jgi:hypothetical protein
MMKNQPEALGEKVSSGEGTKQGNKKDKNSLYHRASQQ